MEITKPALLGGVETRAGEKQKRRDRLKELRRYLIVALTSVVFGLVVIYARRESSAPVSFVRWLAAVFRDPVSLLATLGAISVRLRASERRVPGRAAALPAGSGPAVLRRPAPRSRLDLGREDAGCGAVVDGSL